MIVWENWFHQIVFYTNTFYSSCLYVFLKGKAFISSTGCTVESAHSDLICLCAFVWQGGAAVVNNPLLISSFKKPNESPRSTEVLLHLCLSPWPKEGQNPYESWPRALSIWMLWVMGLSSSRTWPAVQCPVPAASAHLHNWIFPLVVSMRILL